MQGALNGLNRYRYRFYTKPVHIKTSKGLFVIPRNGLRSQLLTGRGLSMFRYHDFSNVPRNRRTQALAQSIRLWSPFENTDYHCYWEEGSAMVWYWDAHHSSSPAGEGEVNSPALTILPETTFLPKKSQGVYLQECHQGVDLQYWKNDRLIDSRWFSKNPGEDVVRDFCLQHKLPEQTEPVWSPLDWRKEPWRQSLTPQQWLQANEKIVISVALIIFSVIILWQETRYWKAHWLAAQAAEQHTMLSAELAPLLQARNELQRSFQTNEAILAAIGEPSQARLMTLVSNALPSDEALFKQWRYQRGQLEIIIEDSSADPIEYVKRLQAEPLFSDVRTEQARGKDSLKLLMVINR